MVKTKVSDWVERNFFSLAVFHGIHLVGDVHASVTMDRHVQGWQWIGNIAIHHLKPTLSICLLTWGLGQYSRFPTTVVVTPPSFETNMFQFLIMVELIFFPTKYSVHLLIKLASTPTWFMINIFPLPLGIINPPRNNVSHFFPSILFFPTEGLFLIAIYTTFCDLHCITFHHDKRPYILLTYIFKFWPNNCVVEQYCQIVDILNILLLQTFCHFWQFLHLYTVCSYS